MKKLFIKSFGFIGRLAKAFAGWCNCKIGNHDYTCAAGEGIRPTKDQLANGMAGFEDYAKMYCKRPGCKYVYKKRR